MTSVSSRETALLQRRLARAADRLRAAYGRPRHRRSPPLDGLIQTVLSQNTSDHNSGEAFRSLKRAFPTWSLAAAATPTAIFRAIRSGGLGHVKSRRILAVLRAVRAREGRYDLAVLRRLDMASADARLRGLPGVGPKTRACVLLFDCGHPAFPVDTHVQRIAKRMRFIPERADSADAHARLGAAVPPARALDLHLNLIRLGRELCRPRAPRCAACPLLPDCPHSRGGQ